MQTSKNPSDIEGSLRHLFEVEKLNDILVSGYTENNGVTTEFHPMLWWIFIRFESGIYLRLSSLNQWHLKLEIVDKIEPQFDVEENEFCIASIKNALVFNSEIDLKIEAFHFLLDSEHDITAGIVKTGGFQLSNGDSLFFDPSSDTGIRMGSKEQVFRWTSQLHCPIDSYKAGMWNFV